MELKFVCMVLDIHAIERSIISTSGIIFCLIPGKEVVTLIKGEKSMIEY